MNASTILEGLTQPGQMLAFCDDTDISGAPVEWLAPDLRILCAVVMPSEHYAVAAAEMKERLESLGQTEFHATEIVNPKTSSTWKAVPVEKRLEAFGFLRDQLGHDLLP